MEGETVAANGTSRRRVDDGEQRVHQDSHLSGPPTMEMDPDASHSRLFVNAVDVICESV